MDYRYPQTGFSYEEPALRNRNRGPNQPEYELIDTAVFDGGRFFDITVGYVRQDPEDIPMRISVDNRAAGPGSLPVKDRITDSVLNRDRSTLSHGDQAS